MRKILIIGDRGDYELVEACQRAFSGRADVQIVTHAAEEQLPPTLQVAAYVIGSKSESALGLARLLADEDHGPRMIAVGRRQRDRYPLQDAGCKHHAAPSEVPGKLRQLLRRP